jgi:hypothetical protein
MWCGVCARCVWSTSAACTHARTHLPCSKASILRAHACNAHNPRRLQPGVGCCDCGSDLPGPHLQLRVRGPHRQGAEPGCGRVQRLRQRRAGPVRCAAYADRVLRLCWHRACIAPATPAHLALRAHHPIPPTQRPRRLPSGAARPKHSARQSLLPASRRCVRCCCLVPCDVCVVVMRAARAPWSCCSLLLPVHINSVVLCAAAHCPTVPRTLCSACLRPALPLQALPLRPLPAHLPPALPRPAPRHPPAPRPARRRPAPLPLCPHPPAPRLSRRPRRAPCLSRRPRRAPRLSRRPRRAPPRPLHPALPRAATTPPPPLVRRVLLAHCTLQR